MYLLTDQSQKHTPWNKGKLVGQKAPLKRQEIWNIRIRLQLAQKTRELALFNLAIDSKLSGCDLLKLKVCDILHGDQITSRALIMQQKTKQVVQFVITTKTRESLKNWISEAQFENYDYLFPSRVPGSIHLSVRQYARIVAQWPGVLDWTQGLMGRIVCVEPNRP